MAKIKTHKGTAKRFRVTKNKKVLKRMAGQAHFNGKESGKTRRGKRSDAKLGSEALSKTVRILMNKQ